MIVVIGQHALHRPTDFVREQIDLFYQNTSFKFELNETLSHFNPSGFGDITYFTVFNDDLVLVSIRGTNRLYDWLVNLDTWAESLIYQVRTMMKPLSSSSLVS
jgi:hypothetical protein